MARQEAIERCIGWVDEMGGKSEAFAHVMPLHRISFESKTEEIENGGSSYRPPMVGVFAKQAIKQGDILLTVAQDCIVSESHPLLEELAKVVDKAMAVYKEKLTLEFKKNPCSPWDPYFKAKGRVLGEDELRLALQLALLFYTRHKGRDFGGSSVLIKAVAHFVHYMDALPSNYDSLVLKWTEEEIDNLKGTACHSVVGRLRQEVEDSWNESFQEVMIEYLRRQSLGGEIDRGLLKRCFVDAVCTVYSRMHALDVVADADTASRSNTRCTCPLVDLINGDREDSPRCNTHLLQYPGSHVALQATRNIAAGEELLFSYGQISNLSFVKKFGFLPLNKQGNPQMDYLDVVHVLPPPHFVWPEADPRWQSLTSRNGKPLERHSLVTSSIVSAQIGTPFALLGDKKEMAKVRTTENERPHYLENFHLFAMMSLTDPEVDPEEQVIEPWEPGAIIMEMMDYRLQDLPTASLKEDQEMLAKQSGNFKTGTLYRMLERELVQLWKHAAAKQYDVYGEKDSKGVKFLPSTDKDACAVCKGVLAGPPKACTQCKTVSYCTRTCQKEDWKAGHREACRPVPT